jgi:hypothetical protein
LLHQGSRTDSIEMTVRYATVYVELKSIISYEIVQSVIARWYNMHYISNNPRT